MTEPSEEFFLKALNLKDEKRTGWELRNIEQPESVAGHSWGTALLCLIHADKEDVDRDRCIRMALIHDLAEAETGDFVTRKIDDKQEVSKDNKEEMEEEVMGQMFRNREELLELWKEYEERETTEARFVKDMDLIDMCLQALKYEKDNRYDPEEENEDFEEYERLDEFFATSEPRLNTDTGKELFAKVKKQYEAAK